MIGIQGVAQNLPDTEQESNVQPSPTNKAGDKMEAAYGALFEPTGEDALNTYSTILNEKEQTGNSVTSRGIKQALADEDTALQDIELTNMLVDPSVDMDTKQQIYNAPVSEPKEQSYPERFRKQLIAQDDDDGAGVSELLRTSVIDSLTEFQSFRQTQQELYDSAMAKNDPSLMNTVGSIINMIIPFAEQTDTAEMLARVGKGELSLGALALNGTMKRKFNEAWRAMPLAERKEAGQQFIDAIQKGSTTLGFQNKLIARDMTQKLLYGGENLTEEVTDDLFSILDVVGVGSALKAVGKSRKIVKAISSAEEVMDVKPFLRTDVKPQSPLRAASDTNPKVYKDMLKTVVSAEGDEAAEALAGTTKAEVVADAVMPEMYSEFGVRAKPQGTQSVIKASIKEAIDEAGVNTLTDAEKASAVAKQVSKVVDPTGIIHKDNMLQVESTPTGVKLHAAYGPENEGWLTAEDAYTRAEIAFRDIGVDRNDMYLLQKNDTTGQYEKVLDEDNVEGTNFLVGMDYNYKAIPEDVARGDHSLFEVTRNLLDRVPVIAEKKITRHIFDPASLFDKFISEGSFAKVDKAAYISDELLDVGKNFAVKMGGFEVESRAQVMDYIERAGRDKIKFDPSSLRNDYNFTEDQINAVRSFREYWDNVWFMRNAMDVRVMRGQGYGFLKDSKAGDNILVKPRERAFVNLNEPIYVTKTGVSRRFGPDELDELYNKGYKVGTLRKPTKIGGYETNQALIPPDNSWRLLNDSDELYPYVEGYYQRQYKHKHFIIKKERTEGGTVYDKAVATAETASDAKLYIKQLVDDAEAKATMEGRHFDRAAEELKYSPRGDIKENNVVAGFEMDTFDGLGLSNQRHRGEQLTDATSVVRGGKPDNIIDPTKAMINASRSMGSRVAMQEHIRSLKTRFIDNYKSVLVTKDGMVQYPSDVWEIGEEGKALTKEAADARTMYEYISYLENGYVNMLDAVAKSGLKLAAKGLGNIGLRRLEGGLEKASELSISGLIKAVPFQLYIATNPHRQALLNMHQITMLSGIFPKYVGSGKITSDLTAFAFLNHGKQVPKAIRKLTGRTQGEYELMFKQYNKSGLSQGIHQSNMIRSELINIADRGLFDKSSGIAGKALAAPRKLGFDLGEEINLRASWLSSYDEAKSAGDVLDATRYEKITGKARNVSLGQNKAGDMPYNQSSLSTLFMYMQIPHKSVLLATNRGLSVAERSRAVTSSLLLWSFPTQTMYGLFGGMLPAPDKHPELHEAVVQGLEFYTLNKFLSLAYGEDVGIDFSGMAPMDMYGLTEFISSLLEAKIDEAVQATPAGQLFFNNGRVTRFIKSAISWATPTDWTNEKNPATAKRVFHDLVGLSSGTSNAYKAYLALRTNKVRSSITGVAQDDDVNAIEAGGILFGLPTLDAQRSSWIAKDKYEKSEKMTQDIKTYIKNVETKLYSEGITPEEQEWVMKVAAEGFAEFPTDSARKIILADIKSKTSKGKDSLISWAFNNKLDKKGDLLNRAKATDPETYSTLIKLFEDIDKISSTGGDK